MLALQSHFYRPELSEEIEKLAMTDWIATLGTVPQAAIEQAIGERIGSADRTRPTPGEIRERAMARVEKPALKWNAGDKPFGPRLVEIDPC